ncbi:transposase family protein [Streptomyces boninensis]|uniref:transposase family protein n=1 Tax=Streptomyces boninensis TaxID=2039455 RepID=UPI003B221500
MLKAVTDADIETTADSGYQGAGGCVRTPIKRPAGKGHNGWGKQANTALAKVRAPVERGFAALKRWRVLDCVRISPNRITTLLNTLFVIQQKQASLAGTWMRSAHYVKPVR